MTENKNFTFIGITGGIGAGKSTVADFFRAENFPVISADELAKQITLAGSATLQEIQKIFGTESILASGELNRIFVRKKITEDAKLRNALNAITHPKIQKLCIEYSEELARKGNKIIFYEAPLLFEANSERNLDAVITVIADDSIRIQRTMKRDKSTKDAAKKLLEAQMPQSEKIKKSQYIIDNSSSLAALKKETQKILAEIKSKYLR